MRKLRFLVQQNNVFRCFCRNFMNKSRGRARNLIESIYKNVIFDSSVYFPYLCTKSYSVRCKKRACERRTDALNIL